jgi:hypothetical protein
MEKDWYGSMPEMQMMSLLEHNPTLCLPVLRGYMVILQLLGKAVV